MVSQEVEESKSSMVGLSSGAGLDSGLKGLQLTEDYFQKPEEEESMLGLDVQQM